jgi:hypothetical protein
MYFYAGNMISLANFQGIIMRDQVYKKTEIVGSSKTTIEDAIEKAI